MESDQGFSIVFCGGTSGAHAGDKAKIRSRQRRPQLSRKAYSLKFSSCVTKADNEKERTPGGLGLNLSGGCGGSKAILRFQ